MTGGKYLVLGARGLGFHECIDTEQMFRSQLAALQNLGVLLH